MKKTINLKNLVLLFSAVFNLSFQLQADNIDLKKSKKLVDSIQSAIKRSNTEQIRIKIRFDEEVNERMQSWSDEDIKAMDLKPMLNTKNERIDLGKPDFSIDQSGVDQSGLDRLRSSHSDHDEDPIVIDFDEELREVSSAKD